MKTKSLYVYVLSILLVLAVSISGHASGGCGSSGSSCGTAAPQQEQPAASGGCGSSGSSCGASAPQQAQPDKLNLTPAQKTKLAEIDRKCDVKTQALQKSFMQKRDALMKLIDNPKTSDALISKKMHELGNVQAELQLADVFAQRAKDRVYTSQQKAILAKGSGGGCGCGGGAGGAKPANNKAPAPTSGGCGGG